jgi:hypothetical protein
MSTHVVLVNSSPSHGNKHTDYYTGNTDSLNLVMFGITSIAALGAYACAWDML